MHEVVLGAEERQLRKDLLLQTGQILRNLLLRLNHLLEDLGSQLDGWRKEAARWFPREGARQVPSNYGQSRVQGRRNRVDRDTEANGGTSRNGESSPERSKKED